MADIQVVIKLREGEDGTLTSLGSTSEVNNASIQRASDNVFTKMSEKNDGKNLKSWAKGYLSLADGYVGGADTKLIEQYGYNGYVFGATDSNGKLNVTMQIYGTDLSGIIVYGDKQANQFPTEAYLDGDENNRIYNGDLIWTITFDEPASYKEITFTKWNRAEYNACLTSVQKLSVELVFDKSNIKTLESLSQSTGQPNNIFYGVVPNSGSMQVVDRQRELLDLIKNGLLPSSKIPTQVIVNGQKVQEHIVVDSNYSKSDGIFSLEKTNVLENLDSINFAGFDLSENETTAYDLFNRMMTVIGYTEEQIAKAVETKIVAEQLSDNLVSVREYMEAVKIQRPYMDSSTAREAIDKFCNLLQLQFIADNDGNPVFVPARPVVNSENLMRGIVIPAKAQLSTFEKTEIVKNEYDAVELSVKKLQPKTEYDTIVGVYSDSQITDFYNPINNSFAKTSIWSTGLNYYDYAEAFEKLYYKNISFTIPKKQNKNFEEVIKLLYGLDANGNPNIDFSVKYIEERGKAQGWFTVSYDETMRQLRGSVTDIDYYMEKPDPEKPIQGTFSYDADLSVVAEQKQHTSGAKAEITTEYANQNNKSNLKTISIGSAINGIVDNGDSYTINAIVLIAKRAISLGISGQWQKNGVNQSPIYGTSVFWRPLQLEVSFNGNKRVIDISDMSVSDENISVSGNPVSLQGSELLQSDTKLANGTNMAEQLKANIHSDYSGGVSTARVSVVCMDYYDINGEKAKDWANGDIFNIGDIVRVDRDNFGNPASEYKDGGAYFWKVIGRTFRYAGVPVVDLELQEAKLPRPLILTIPKGLIVESRGDRIYNGHEVPFGESVIVRGIDFTLPSNLSTLNWIKANGTEIEVGQEIPVNSDITFSYSYTPVQIFSLGENDMFTTFQLDKVVSRIIYNPSNYGIMSIESPPMPNELTLNVLSADYDVNDPSYNAGVERITLNPDSPVVGAYENGSEYFEYEITHRDISFDNISSDLIGRTCFLEGAYIMPEIIK